MATIEDVRPAILESQVFDNVIPGQPFKITATLLDLQNDTVPFVKTVREQRAQAFGMLFFRSESPECCVDHEVFWLRLEGEVIVAADDTETGLLEERAFMGLCFLMTATFLDTLAHRDPKYSALAISTVH